MDIQAQRNILNQLKGTPTEFKKTKKGSIWVGDSLLKMRKMRDASIDLCVTSPPYPLVTKKKYGNVKEKEYVEWFIQFASEIHRLLKPSGSLVIDLGTCWEHGKPVRSTYDMRLALKLIDDLNFYFAQEFYWFNPSKLPVPAQWVTVEKVRVKDSVNKILWFSKSDRPKADNSKVLKPYSDEMEKYFNKDVKEVRRPSGHKPSGSFKKRNAGAIPGNLLALPNASSSDDYLNYCRDMDLDIHPARFPIQLPEFFIRFLTNPGDKVLDPFAGSCTTGIAAELTERKWVCIEKEERYVEGASGYLASTLRSNKVAAKNRNVADVKIPRLGVYAE